MVEEGWLGLGLFHFCHLGVFVRVGVILVDSHLFCVWFQVSFYRFSFLCISLINFEL
jgi:hypothetical protein